MQFLAFLESVASNINAQNIEQFVTLTENMITLGESVFKHQSATTTAQAASPTNTTTNTAS